MEKEFLILYNDYLFFIKIRDISPFEFSEIKQIFIDNRIYQEKKEKLLQEMTLPDEKILDGFNKLLNSFQKKISIKFQELLKTKKLEIVKSINIYNSDFLSELKTNLDLIEAKDFFIESKELFESLNFKNEKDLLNGILTFNSDRQALVLGLMNVLQKNISKLNFLTVEEIDPTNEWNFAFFQGLLEGVILTLLDYANELKKK